MVGGRPVIGIATQTLQANPTLQLPLTWIMGQRYVRALTSRGAVPWLIPLMTDDEDTLKCIYDLLDGVFLTGGVDVEPKCYGESKHEKCGATDSARDWAEIALVRWAMEDRKPILGVCRGIQVLNVAAGGTLYQDVGAQYKGAIKHDYFPSQGNFQRDMLAHPIQVRSDSRLGGILAESSVDVNSMHHQGIKDLAKGFVPNAHAPDGLIEGIEGANGHYVVGVQWHPEELVDSSPGMHRLFASFVEAASVGKA